ncbi:MAG TPA: carboxylating nicotinate-nucleotide diphosphorylase, partial [Acidimicrobiales bacterium]|nr:carboxylating nicotinate-nucleotide diphosphorylase [Acidimicrobiales bacterium]
PRATPRAQPRAQPTMKRVALDSAAVARVVHEALAEDVGSGDLTTNALFPPEARARAHLLVKEPGVVCGLPVAEAVFRSLDPEVRFEAFVPEGQHLRRAGQVAAVEGSARAVLSGERTALNLMGRLSGVATMARAFVDAVTGTSAVILDTRKTTPGLRVLEKYATSIGGATNHRQGLHDGILVKDNHLALSADVRTVVDVLRRVPGGHPVEVEVESLEEVRAALDAGADALLLDNMSLEAMSQAVALTGFRATLEASGGVSLANVRAVAGTGVDYISVGALTHAARSLDVSLEVQ